MQISTIGIDIAKNVFQVHGVDAAGKPVLKKQLRRGQMLEFFGKLPPCLIGMEACATSHHWARELRQLINAMRAHLAELGLVAQTGREGVQQLMRTVAEADNERLPSDARVACQ